MAVVAVGGGGGEWQGSYGRCVVWVVALLLVLIHTVLVLRWIGMD